MLLSVATAAERLGISKKTLLGHVRSGALRYVITGLGTKRPRKGFTAADIEDFITRQTRREMPACPSTGPKTRKYITTISNIAVFDFAARRAQKTDATPRA